MPTAPHDPPMLELRPMLERLLEQVDELGRHTNDSQSMAYVHALIPIAQLALLERIAVALERRTNEVQIVAGEIRNPAPAPRYCARTDRNIEGDGRCSPCRFIGWPSCSPKGEG